MARLLAAIAMVLALACPLGAQPAESRAEEIAGQQREKAAQAAPRPPNSFEQRGSGRTGKQA